MDGRFGFLIKCTCVTSIPLVHSIQLPLNALLLVCLAHKSQPARDVDLCWLLWPPFNKERERDNGREWLIVHTKVNGRVFCVHNLNHNMIERKGQGELSDGWRSGVNDYCLDWVVDVHSIWWHARRTFDWGKSIKVQWKVKAYRFVWRRIVFGRDRGQVSFIVALWWVGIGIEHRKNLKISLTGIFFWMCFINF